MASDEAALQLLRQLANDFNVRDARKLHQLARREFPDRPDLTQSRARVALREDVARQVLAPKPRSQGKSAAEGPNDRLQADLIDFSQNTRSRNKCPARTPPRWPGRRRRRFPSWCKAKAITW